MIQKSLSYVMPFTSYGGSKMQLFMKILSVENFQVRRKKWFSGTKSRFSFSTYFHEVRSVESEFRHQRVQLGRESVQILKKHVFYMYVTEPL